MAKVVIDEKKVEAIAELAKLSVSVEQKRKFTHQFEETLSVVADLDELNTEKEEITTQVTGRYNVWREDEVDSGRGLTQVEALGQAKRSYKGYFVVDRLIE